jgi:hypothetical protein
MTADAAAALAVMPAVVPTVFGTRGWNVPRTYAALHPEEIRGANLVGAAARYGWNPAEMMPVVREAGEADFPDDTTGNIRTSLSGSGPL